MIYFELGAGARRRLFHNIAPTSLNIEKFRFLSITYVKSNLN